METPEMTKIFSPASDESVTAYWERRPSWCRADQTRTNAATLIGAAASIDCGNMLEIGSSAGEGAAALLHGSRSAKSTLFGIDLATHVYYDKTKPIGAVVGEAFPEYAPRYTVYDGCTSKRARDLEHKFALVHIDGAHSHPWALLDLLNVLGVIEEGSILLFDDAVYYSPLSQAAHYLAHELADMGQYFGAHFAIVYPGPTEKFLRKIRNIISMNWQSPVPLDELEGLLAYLRGAVGDLQAAAIMGDLLAAHERFMRNLPVYGPLNDRLWKNEIERRANARGGQIYLKHE